MSDLVRNPKGLIAQRLEAVGEETVCTSLVVSAELRFGARKKGSERLLLQIETVLSALDILPLEEPVDEHTDPSAATKLCTDLAHRLLPHCLDKLLGRERGGHYFDGVDSRFNPARKSSPSPAVTSQLALAP